MKTAVFFIPARIEITAVLYFLRKGVKLHFYSSGTIFEENIWGVQRGAAPWLWVSNKKLQEMRLHSDYERIKGILERIPPDIIRQYTHRSTQKHDINR